MADAPMPPPPPRSVPGSAWGVGTSTAITLGLLLTAVGVVGGVVMMSTGSAPWDDWILDARGVNARAVVLGRRAVNVRARTPDAYVLSWRSTDAAGREVRGTAYGRASDADSLQVEYDPDDPTRARVVGRSAMRAPGVVAAQLALCALGLPLLAAGVSRARRRRALYREGGAVRGVVLGCDATWMRSDGETVYRVSVRYPSPQGEQTLVERTPGARTVGDAAWVLVDPHDPSRAMLS
ncbi:MAG: DUF3592 domain-containing protein [Polyangiales bacterium]